jgi:hypothetical protein
MDVTTIYLGFTPLKSSHVGHALQPQIRETNALISASKGLAVNHFRVSVIRGRRTLGREKITFCHQNFKHCFFILMLIYLAVKKELDI